MDEIIKRDQNFVTVLAGVTNDSDQDITMLRVDPITKRLLVSATGGGTGSPGGLNTQVQYNNAGSFGGITGATSNGITLTLIAPILGTPASGVATNLTGTAAGLTAGNVITNANLTGDVTSVGNATTVKSNLALPGSPTTTTQNPFDNSTNIATTAYVDAAFASFDTKPAVAYASTAALPANTYANGASGVGATLTGTLNGPLVIDGVTLVVGQAGEYVLVAGEATQANNGWYVITQVGVVAVSKYILTRLVDSDQAAEIGSGYITSVIVPNGVTAGSSNNGKVFISVAAADPFVVGTTALTFSQVGSVYSAGNGISLSGTTFSINTAITADLTTAQTFSGKRITKRVLALSAGSATPAINTDLYDVVHITAQSAAINTFTSSLSGTPVLLQTTAQPEL